MSSFDSAIVLGRRYRHRDTGLEGIAESVHFYRNACERVVLQYLHDGDIKDASFDAVDLVDVVAPADPITSSKRGGPARTMPPRR